MAMQENELIEKLTLGWSTVHEQSGQSIDWIRKARRSSPRLENEADHLILKLRRARNLAKSLQQVTQSSSTVGFFGLSQAGKSYLISALAAGANGNLETELDGQRLDFVTHVNPPGGGKEATGLVTRFTRQALPSAPGFPLHLRLFCEIDLVKIFANSFFNDFNFEKTGFTFEGSEAAAAHQAINEAQKRRQPNRVPGVTEDDVVDLWDYLRARYPWTVASLEGDFLPRLVDLAPFLSISDRAGLFAFLWGRITNFTSLFLNLANRLAELKHPSIVLAPLAALVQPAPSGDGFVQRDSIMNVDILERLGRDDGDELEICTSDHPEHRVRISRAELAAITAELIFSLANEPAQPLFNSVDLLDFPGYRGRLDLESFEDLSAASGQGQKTSPVTQLFLRGKVAYLFERYTDLQEMNVLVVCTASHKQSDVADVGPVLSGWVHRTQGETPEQRASRPSGLVWAITMFDMKIADSLTKDAPMLDMVWDNLIKMTMLERFQQYPWMQTWSTDHPFDTTFLVRKPRLPVTFLSLEGDKEASVHPNSEGALALMEQTFVANPLVGEHVANPKDAWTAMLALNDGGISRLSDYLGRVAIRGHKLARLSEQLNEILQDLIDGRLGPWFHHEGADEIQARRRTAEDIVNALRPRVRLLGDLQDALMLSDDILQSLYLNSEFEPHGNSSQDQKAETSQIAAVDLGDDLGFDDNLDLFGEKSPSGPSREPTVAQTSSDARFVKAVIREWINHLRGIPENARLVAYLGLPRKALEQLTDELVTAITRFELEQKLLARIAQTEQVGTKRERLVQRQVLAVQAILGDFLVWLGQQYTPQEDRDHSRVNVDAALFATAPRIASGQLPPVTNQAASYTRSYLGDWLVSLAKLIVENAGHDAGREISGELNAALGGILNQLKQSRIVQP